MKYIEVAESSEQRQEREKATSKCRPGLAASLLCSAWGYSVRETCWQMCRQGRKSERVKVATSLLTTGEILPTVRSISVMALLLLAAESLPRDPKRCHEKKKW